MPVALKRLIFFGGLLLIWYLVFLSGIKPVTLLPSPQKVFMTIYDGFRDMSLLVDLGASFRRLLIGIAIGLTIGVCVGIVLARWKAADDTLGLLVLALQSVPSIVWLPVAIMWFGMGELPIVFIIILGSSLVMTINMRMGIKNVPPLYIRAARTMGSSGFDLFVKVIVPASIPHAVTGARLGWAFGWRGLMAAELLSTGPGLGYTLQYASAFGDMATVIGIIIIIGIIGSIVDLFLFQRIERMVFRRWGLEGSK